ncbi:MAG: anaerobic ribonucleoside-triphosphate reductase [Thermoprotei archaeon]|jgi:ribonucleoside-triphosphate reductase
MPRRIEYNIFGIVSEGKRIEILKLLGSYGSLRFSEIKEKLHLRQEETSNLSYHIRMLQSHGLIDKDLETSEYILTGLGRKVLELINEIETSMKYSKLLVRTSKPALEPFDSQKIVSSLIREAKLPRSLAEDIAREAELRLSKMPIKYLTSTFIRELVNSILVERGLDDVRLQVMRLGLPVHDVHQTIFGNERKIKNPRLVHYKLSSSMLKDYTLLRILSKDLSDAHSSGDLHIIDLDEWPLSTVNINHDARILLNYRFDDINSFLPSNEIKSLNNALMRITYMLYNFDQEVSGGQSLPFFNFLLAPYTRNIPDSELITYFIHFIYNINNIFTWRNKLTISLGLHTDLPKGFENLEIKIDGTVHTLNEYIDEAHRVFNAFISALLQLNSNGRPLILPIIHVYIESLSDDSKNNLMNAIKLSLTGHTVTFINKLRSSSLNTIYTNDFYKVALSHYNVLQYDIASVTAVNMPRLVMKSNLNESALPNFIGDVIRSATRIAASKNNLLELMIKNETLPYTLHEYKGAPYINNDNVFHVIVPVGLYEAIILLTDHDYFSDSSSRSLLIKILNETSKIIREYSEQENLKILFAQNIKEEPAYRFSILDRKLYPKYYGILMTSTKPGKYSNGLAEEWRIIDIQDLITLDSEIDPFLFGGHAIKIWLSDELSSQEIITDHLSKTFSSYNVSILQYNKNFVFCMACKRLSIGIQKTCPVCGARGKYLIYYANVENGYQFISDEDTKLSVIERTTHEL